MHIAVFKKLDRQTEQIINKAPNPWTLARQFVLCSNLQVVYFLVEGSMHLETDPLHIVEPERNKAGFTCMYSKYYKSEAD